MKKIVLFSMTAFLAISFLACGKKSVETSSETHTIQDREIEIKKHWTNENGVICIVFGYGFNDPVYYAQSVEKLSDIYGLNQNGGLILPLVYPEDFKSGIRGLHKTLEGTKVKGMIFLGAPDETHLLLARYQDENGGEIPFPVISLFPQDNILGQESTCSLILDYEHSSESDATITESSLSIGADAELIFTNSVKFMANMTGTLKIGPELKDVATKIVGTGNDVRRYIDRGSGMQALNHYIVEGR